MLIDVIIPAFNEQDAIQHVISDLPKDLIREVIVVDNNSTDSTSEKANKAGATVLFEKNKGYGNACLKGINYLNAKEYKPDLVVFIDGDYSDYPSQLSNLILPITKNNVDMVIGSRSLGNIDSKAMPFQQRFGNWLSTSLIYLLFRFKYTDLGPFRAIKFNKLKELNMQDTTYGWTVEMQLKAIKKKFVVVEVPVDYRQRIGVSKISGTLKGTILAGFKILSTIFKYSIVKI